MQFSTWGGFLLLPILAFSFPQQSQLTAPEILQKVADAYQHLRSYRITALSETTLKQIDTVHYGGTADSGDTENYTMLGQSDLVTAHIEIAGVEPGKIRLTVKQEHKGPGGAADQFIVASDGQSSWAYKPLDKQYTEESAPLSGSPDSNHPAIAGETKVVREYWNLLLGRFRDVARFGPVASLEKEAKLKVNGEKADCYVVEIQMEGVTDQLWVDKVSFLVWRLKQTPRGKPPVGTTRVADVLVNVTAAELNPQFDESEFKLTDFGKATKVPRLKWPGQN